MCCCNVKKIYMWKHKYTHQDRLFAEKNMKSLHIAGGIHIQMFFFFFCFWFNSRVLRNLSVFYFHFIFVYLATVSYKKRVYCTALHWIELISHFKKDWTIFFLFVFVSQLFAKISSIYLLYSQTKKYSRFLF